MRHIAILILTLFVMTAPGSAKAELVVDVNNPNMQPMPIAITSFHAEGGANGTIANDMPQVISENLERSGLFKPVNPRAFVQNTQSIAKEGVRFAEWRATNAQALVTGEVTRTNDGRTRVEFRLWDVFSEKQLTGMAYMTSDANWRRIAHIISDEIYKRLTGEDGYFDLRIVYVSETGSPTQRVKRLAIMDQDGHNHKFLTDGNNLVLTPRFSPSQQTIAYLAYVNDRPRVYIYDINTGRQQALGDFPGMTFAPRFSPDGNKVIMSQSLNGNTDIYEIDVRSKAKTRVTSAPSIETAPSYSQDGRQIVFESDRGGSQQLYTMNRDGSNVQRITFGKRPLCQSCMVATRRFDCFYPYVSREILYRGYPP